MYTLANAIIDFHNETPGLPENFLAIEHEKHGLKGEDNSTAWRRVKYLLAIHNGQPSPYRREPRGEQYPQKIVVDIAVTA